MIRRRDLALVVAIASAALSSPGLVAAADHRLCVAPGGEEPKFEQDCSDGTWPTFAGALAAAASLPDTAPDVRPSIEIRLLGGALADPHVESIFIDNRFGVYGRPLEILFDGRALCPDAVSAPGEPVLEWIVDGFDGARGLTIDLSAEGACPSEHAGVLTYGGGGFGLDQADIVGFSNWGVATGLVGSAAELSISRSSFRAGTGAAIRSSGAVRLDSSEVLGCRLESDSSAPGIVWADGVGAYLEVTNSVFFANLVEPGKDVRGLLVGPSRIIQANAFIANGLDPEHSLIVTGFDEWGHLPGTTPADQTEQRGLLDNVVSRTRFVSDSSGALLPTPPRSAWLDGVVVPYGCPASLTEPPYQERPSPFEDFDAGAGTVLQLDPTYGFPTRGGFLAARNFVVDNGDDAGARLVRARLASNQSLQILHNTFGGNGQTGVIDVETGSSSAELVVVRNLFADEGQPLLVRESLGGLFVSMNLVLAEGEPVLMDDAGATFELRGPWDVRDHPDFFEVEAHSSSTRASSWR